MKKKQVRVQQPEIDRRTFLSTLGWAGVGVSAVAAALGNILYLKPAVDYEYTLPIEMERCDGSLIYHLSSGTY